MGLSPARARRVLIVEDNPDNRLALHTLLELWGYAVDEAPDGAQAIQLHLQHRPEIALIDIGLPRMDGYELARHIRAEARGKRPYLVAVTGYGLPEDRKRTLEAGFDLHLVKPVSAATLADVLARG